MRRVRRVLSALAAVACPACGSETSIAVAADCPAGLAIHEVFASNATVLSATTGRSDDWVELVYDPPPGDPPVLDLEGFGLAATREKLIRLEAPVHITAGGFLVVVASPYAYQPEPGAPAPPVTGFDLQRDGASVFLLPPWSSDACQEVAYPDQHQDFSWIPDEASPAGTERWCPASWPTDGGRNAPCLCPGSGEC